MKIEEIDREIVSAIVDVLWKHGCSFDVEKINWINRIFDDINCPDEKVEIVSVEIEEAIGAIEAKYINEILDYKE